MSIETRPSGSHPSRGPAMTCRLCGSGALRTFIDLGMSPLCETYPSEGELNRGEMFYPLHALVCEQCLLVQLDEYVLAESIFSDYPYFSSYSESWLRHADNYCEKMTSRFGLGNESLAVEVASNDGYLLQYFVKRGIPVLGIEPAGNVAEVAVAKGIRTVVKFFGSQLAKELTDDGLQADLIAGNNVLAQVPALNDFVDGLRIMLKPDGVITLEFPHLQRLIEHNEFDTIYHEHFSYFSFGTTVRLIENHGLRVFDVDELPTHGGSLRVYACRRESPAHRTEPSVERLMEIEEKAGLCSVSGYEGFARRAEEVKLALIEFLVQARREGKRVVGYGAPGKSATLLHYCGIGKDLIEFTVDRSPHKQRRFLPGTHIPIQHPDRIKEAEPDYVVILPWNLSEEIMQQLQYIRQWGGRFVVPIPKLVIL